MQLTLPSGTPADLRRPADGTTPTRGLVVIPDIGGLRPLFTDRAQAISDERGWAVCVFEPWVAFANKTLAERLEGVGDLSDKQILGDAVAAADACGVEPVGVTGFCLGGMYTLKAAGTGRFGRAVAFYGMIRVPERWQGPDQSEPLDALANPQRCSTMAIIGTADIWTPTGDVDALEAAGVEVVRYQDAEHGFAHDPDRPAHRAADAADAWDRALTFLSG